MIETEFNPVSSAAPEVFGPEGVVLIHGLGRSAMSMWPMARRLKAAGFEVARAAYPSRRLTLEAATDRVAGQVAMVSGGWSRVRLAGHSLGGVIARRLARTRPDLRIGRVVQLGSPNLGSAAAQRLSRYRLARWVFGPVLTQIALLPTSVSRMANVGAIAGTVGVGAPRRLHGLAGPHDGLVSVRSAWAGAAARAAVPVIHSMLPFSRAAAGLTARFIKTGSFGQTGRQGHTS